MTSLSMVGLGRVELPTRSLGNCCSIRLSYSPTSNDSIKSLLALGHFLKDAGGHFFHFDPVNRQLN